MCHESALIYLQPVFLQHKPVVIRHKLVVVCHKPVVVRHKLVVNYHQLVVVRHKLVVVYHQLVVIHHKQVVIHHKLVVIYHQLVVIYQISFQFLRIHELIPGQNLRMQNSNHVRKQQIRSCNSTFPEIVGRGRQFAFVEIINLL